MTKDKLKFKNRIIAFIDILGFKGLVKNNDKIITEIVKILSFIKEHDTTLDPCRNNNKKIQKILCNYSSDIITFSDNIIISVQVTPPTHNNDVPFFSAIQYIISNITYFQIALLAMGIATRGAISYGKVYYDEDKNIIIGEPLIEAIEAEANSAIYPRVITTQSLNAIHHSYRWFRRDFDGTYFVDYFLDRAFDEFNFFQNMNTIRQQIELNINQLTKMNKAKELSKWCWIANYFDTYLNFYQTNKNKRFIKHLHDDKYFCEYLSLKKFDLLKQNCEEIMRVTKIK